MSASKRRRLGAEALLGETAESADGGSAVLVRGDLVVLPDRVLRPGFVLIDPSGTIASITSVMPSDSPPEGGGTVRRYHAECVLPGMVDIHTHGLGGADDVVDYWGNAAYSLRRLARQGTTSCLATVVFQEEEAVAPLCASIQRVCDEPGLGCVLRGIHAEGPVVATLGGLPDASKMAASGVQGFERLLTKIGPCLRIMTISPSCDAPVNYGRIRTLVERNVRVALGHDKLCTEAQILRALGIGGSRFHVTHSFNVQSFHHREPGLANFALCRQFPANLPKYRNLTPPTVEVIADFKHVSPLTLSILLAARQPEDICVITDAISEAMPGKRVKYSNSRIAMVAQDAMTVSTLEGTLCGSCTSMLESLRRLVFNLNVTLVDACIMCATTPAKVAGIDSLVGGIEVGKRGDVLLLGLKRLEASGGSEPKPETSPSTPSRVGVLPPLSCTLVGGQVAWERGPYEK